MSDLTIIEPADIRVGDEIRAEWELRSDTPGFVGHWTFTFVAVQNGYTIPGYDPSEDVTHYLLSRKTYTADEHGLPADELTFGLLRWTTVSGGDAEAWGYWTCADRTRMRMHGTYAFEVPVGRIREWQEHSVAPRSYHHETNAPTDDGIDAVFATWYGSYREPAPLPTVADMRCAYLSLHARTFGDADHDGEPYTSRFDRWIESIRAGAVDYFIEQVASRHAYNGADDQGQRFYDWGLNTWLAALPNPYTEEVPS